MSKIGDILKNLEPEVVQALKIAVGLAAPASSHVAADLAIDTVDTLVRRNNPSIDGGAARAAFEKTGEPVSAAAPTSMEGLIERVAALETNFAALLAATGHDTSLAFQVNKLAMAQHNGTHDVELPQVERAAQAA